MDPRFAERLLSDGWFVAGLDSFAATYDSEVRRSQLECPSSEGGFEFIEEAINRIDLTELLADSVAFHGAARPGVRASWRDFATASDANLLANQKASGVIAAHARGRLIISSPANRLAEESPVPETRQLALISRHEVKEAAREALLSAHVSRFEVSVTRLWHSASSARGDGVR